MRWCLGAADIRDPSLTAIKLTQESFFAMAVKVYGIPRSSCTLRVVAALYEKNVEFELILVNLQKGEHKQAPFLSLQPFGLVPVLQDGDLTIFESRAIVRYIAEKYKGEGAALYGSTVEERALTEQWLEVEGQSYTSAVQPIFYELLLAPMRGLPTDLSVVEASLGKLATVLDVYEEHLARTPYLAGDFFSLADLSHLPQTHHLLSRAEVAELFHCRKHVKAWWDTISSRPAWKKAVAFSAPSFD